jgi:Zn-dependent protease
MITDAKERRVTPAAASEWPLERILFALAGSVTLVSVLLAIVVSPWFLLLTAAVGVNQWLYVTVRACPASLVLTRLGRHRTCEW